MNNFLSAETRKLKSKKEIIKMEEIKEKLRAFIQEKFEIDDDPDFTDDVHLFNEGFVDSFGAVESTLSNRHTTSKSHKRI